MEGASDDRSVTEKRTNGVQTVVTFVSLRVYLHRAETNFCLIFENLSRSKAWFIRNVFCAVFLEYLKWVECIPLMMFTHDVTKCKIY